MQAPNNWTESKRKMKRKLKRKMKLLEISAHILRKGAEDLRFSRECFKTISAAKMDNSGRDDDNKYPSLVISIS